MNKWEIFLASCLFLQCGLTLVWLTTLSRKIRKIEIFLFGKE